MHKKVAPTIINVVNSFCLTLSVIMMVVGGILQWGQTALRLTIMPAFFIMVSKGYGIKALEMAHIAAVTDNYLGMLTKAGLIIFIIGSVLSNICSLGIIGVCCRKGFLILIYIILASIVIVVIIIMIIIFLVKKNQIESSLGQVLQNTLQAQYKFHNDKDNKATVDFSGIIDLIQIRGRCCGSYNGKDYEPIATKDPVPFSCCVMNETASFKPLYDDCPSRPNNVNSYYSTGCSAMIWLIIKKFSEYAAYSLIGLGLVLVVLIIMAVVILKCCGEPPNRDHEHAKPLIV